MTGYTKKLVKKTATKAFMPCCGLLLLGAYGQLKKKPATS